MSADGDGPLIDTTLVDSTFYIGTYDNKTQTEIHRILHDQQQERLGLPMSHHHHQQGGGGNDWGGGGIRGWWDHVAPRQRQVHQQRDLGQGICHRQQVKRMLRPSVGGGGAYEGDRWHLCPVPILLEDTYPPWCVCVCGREDGWTLKNDQSQDSRRRTTTK